MLLTDKYGWQAGGVSLCKAYNITMSQYWKTLYVANIHIFHQIKARSCHCANVLGLKLYKIWANVYCTAAERQIQIALGGSKLHTGEMVIT